MSKKNFFIAVLQVIVIGAFIMMASGSSSSDKVVDNANRIYRGARPLINN